MKSSDNYIQERAAYIKVLKSSKAMPKAVIKQMALEADERAMQMITAERIKASKDAGLD
jgi:shikimate kinase